jgi:thiol-disulfide isomerase/thioredoxin
MSHSIASCLVTLLLAADVGQIAPADQGYTITFEPGVEGSPLAPRYSPKGTQITLQGQTIPGLGGVDHLVGRVQIGPKQNRADGQLVVLARSEKGKPYELLYVDAGQDGSVANDKPIKTEHKLIRGSIWSSFTATLRVNHATADQPAAWQDYPVSFWAVVEKPEESPTIIRFSRRGFVTGKVKADERDLAIVLSDSNNDAEFKPGDWWEIQVDGSRRSGLEHMRPVGDFAWGGGKAWKLVLEGSAGRLGRLVPFDAGISGEEDLARRDGLREDRLAVRAAKPLPFREDIDEALRSALAGKQTVFLKFETEWCGPCKQMHQLVFTAKDVVEAAMGIVCIKVDGDARKDLVEKHTVQGYPTGVLLGSDGKELARYNGYQSVKETTAFFRKLAR